MADKKPAAAVDKKSQPPVEEPRGLSAAAFRQELLQTDRLLAFFILLLAFLLASFPIVDSRLWQSLRTGQLLAAGQFQFGVDPYCYTTAGQTWVHAGWLADFLFFRWYEAWGGAGLVLLRGGVMLLLAALMLRWLPPNAPRLLPLLAVLLALMTLSTRLWVRPEMFSVLGSALTLYLLLRPAEADAPRSWLGPLLRLTAGRFYVFLPLLFAVWANLDEWFLLGPLLVFLWWVGGLIEPGLRGQSGTPSLTPAELRVLPVVLLVGLAACLLNPFHVRVFQVPAELHSTAMAFLDGKFPARRISLSPFNPAGFGATRLIVEPLGLTFCEWAYFGLVGLGAFSILAGGYRNGPRLLAWLGFFFLSAWQARNVAFFAAVAGPLTVLNLGEWLAARPAATAPTRLGVFGQLAARLGLLLFLFAAIFLTVLPLPQNLIGQLLGDARLGLINPRGQVGWSLFADPSMRAVAQWRSPPAFPAGAGQVFHMNFGEPAGYEAWFNPGSKVFLDFRYALHGDTVAEYFQAYEALRDSDPPPSPRLSPEQQRQQLALNSDRIARWEKVFKKYGISHVVVNNRPELRPNPNDPNGQPVRIPRHELLLSLRDEKNEPLFVPLGYVDDLHYVLAWTRSPHLAALKPLRLDPAVLAFQRDEAQPPPISEPPAGGQPSPLGMALRGIPSRFTPDLGGSDFWLRSFNGDARIRREYYSRQLPFDFVSYFAGQLACQPAQFVQPMPYPPQSFPLESAQLGKLYLGLRRARAAIAAVPNRLDAESRSLRSEAYGVLGSLYDVLHEQERVLLRGFPLSTREFQALSARRQALELTPFNPDQHQSFGSRFLSRRGPGGNPEPFLDEGLHHLLVALDQFKQMGRLGSRPATPEEIEIEYKRLINRNLGGKLEDLQKTVDGQMKNFEARARRLGEGAPADIALDRAREALRLGLVRLAEAELRPAFSSTQPAKQREALSLAVELYFGLGRLPELLEKLKLPYAEETLGSSRYHLIAATAQAAAGNFPEAIRHRSALIQALEQEAARNLINGTQFQVVGAQIEPVGSWFYGLRQSLTENINLAQQLAEQRVLLALHYLELGKPAAAAPILKETVCQVDAGSLFSRLAARYYFLIKEEFLTEPNEALHPVP